MADYNGRFGPGDGNFLDHPWARGLVKTSPHIIEDDLRTFWKTPHKTIEILKNEPLVDTSRDSLRMFIVTSGWLYSYSGALNGDQTVHRIYREGDVIGDEDFSRKRNSFDVISATDAGLIEIDVPACRTLMADNRKLLAYVSDSLAHKLLLATDHTKAVVRLNPQARLAHFILSMLARVRFTSPMEQQLDLLHLPLSQKIIANYIGITSVHVSRMFKALTEGNYIARPSQQLIRILDEPGLIDMSEYQDRMGAL